MQALILSNTETIIVVAGDVSFFYDPPNASESYQLINHHIQDTSDAIDSGTNILAAVIDFEGKARPYNTTTDIGVYEWHPAGYENEVLQSRVSFKSADSDNNGYLDSSEWGGLGLSASLFTGLSNGSGQLTMAELLTASGLMLNSFGDVYVDFSASPTGGGFSSNTPVATITEALDLIKLDGTGEIWINTSGSSAETFTGSTQINPAATIKITASQPISAKIGGE